MAGNGGTAVLIAVAIGVSLGLLNQTPTASSTSPTTSSSTASSASSASSTASSTVAVTASSGSTADVTTGTGPAPTPLASCPGREVGQHTANDLTVRIYYDSQSRGLNCVAAVHLGPVTPPGYLQVEIRIADYTGTSWPRYASKSGDPGAAEVGGAYLIGTDGKCVTGTARYFPSGAAGGSTTSVSLSGIGCA